MSPLLDTLLFLSVFAGLSLPFMRLLPRAGAPERLCVGAAGALFTCALAGLAGYLCLPAVAGGTPPADPRIAGLLLPTLALSLLWFLRGDAARLLADTGLRQLLLAFLLVCAGSLGLQSLVVSYSGGAWSADWFEHYQRALFFRDHWPADLRFIGVYPLTARPPLANLATAALLQPNDAAFHHFQIFSCLLSCLAFLPLGALALRHSRLPAAQTLGLLALLCLCSPLWCQNTSFPWTKLPTAFLLLSALLLLEPAASSTTGPWSRHLAWLLLGLAMLTHYSAGPWVLALFGLQLFQNRSRWRKARFWTDSALDLCLLSLPLLPWLVASLAAYGLHGTLATNTTVTAAAPSLVTQSQVILSNIVNTVVPHPLRSPDLAYVSQNFLPGYLRDLFFNLYQLCLPLLTGLSGLCMLLLALGRRELRQAPSFPYWTALVLVGSLLGIAVHSPPDTWGLAHICLQPVGLLGLLLACTLLPSLPPLHRALYWGLLAVDLALGVVLPFLIQTLSLPVLAGGMPDDAGFTAGLNGVAQGNLLLKLHEGLVFFGDLAREWQPLVASVLAVLLLSLLSRALGAKGLRQASRHAIPVAVGATALLLFAGCAWFLWSTFMMYDDEGYVLFAIRNYSVHGGLYDRVYSQYGPFFHVLADTLHRLGWQVTTLGARQLTLVLWIGSTLACLGIAWKLSRNLAAAGLAMAAACIHLQQMSNEPSHPGGLVVMLLGLAALAGCHCMGRPQGFAFVAGLLAAALVLTKINVGLLFIAGAGLWLLLHGLPGVPDRARRPLALALAALMPWVLMKPLLSEPWVLEFALVCSLSFVAVILSLQPLRGARLAPAVLIAGITGFLLLGCATLGVLLLRGSTLHGILDGVLLSPLRMPSVYSVMIKWRPGALAWACSAPLLALLVRRLPETPRRNLLLAGRLLLLLAFSVSLTGLLPFGSLAFASNVALAGTWFFVAPLGKQEETSPALAWLALIGMTQILHAYPVAGSQIGWGSLLWIPLAAIGGQAAWASLTGSGSSLQDSLGRLHTRIVATLMAASVLYFTLVGWNRHSNGETLELPGAEDLVLPESFCATARVLNANLMLHCETAFSLPGMFSFNLWSGLPAPTLANATHWVTLLSERQKQDLLEALRTERSTGLVLQRGLLDYMRERSLPLGGAASRYLQEAFNPRFAVNGYEFWLRKEQAAELIGIARPAQEGGMLALRLNLASPVLMEINSFELRQFEGNTSHLAAHWKEGNFLVRVTPIQKDGSPRGEPRLVRPPLRLAGLNRLEFLVRNCPLGPSRGDRILVFRDAEGNRVAEAFYLKD